MTNNIIINQALDALRASLPVGDVVSTTAVKGNCTNENDVTVKIMNVDFFVSCKGKHNQGYIKSDISDYANYEQ